jgi:V/A-type H+-transporting ATPase subunit D
MVSIEEKDVEICYGLWTTNSQFDHAFILFHEVKMLTARLAEIENSIYKIAIAIKKTQSRANALNNVIIPRFSENVKYITDALEEKEREEFSRMKVLKNKAK